MHSALLTSDDQVTAGLVNMIVWDDHSCFCKKTTPQVQFARHTERVFLAFAKCGFGGIHGCLHKSLNKYDRKMTAVEKWSTDPLAALMAVRLNTPNSWAACREAGSPRCVPHLETPLFTRLVVGLTKNAASDSLRLFVQLSSTWLNCSMNTAESSRVESGVVTRAEDYPQSLANLGEISNVVVEAWPFEELVRPRDSNRNSAAVDTNLYLVPPTAMYISELYAYGFFIHKTAGWSILRHSSFYF